VTQQTCSEGNIGLFAPFSSLGVERGAGTTDNLTIPELDRVTVMKPISTPTFPTSAVPDQPVVQITHVDLTPVMKKLRVLIQNSKG
jgi:hypothetical protein